MLSAFLDPAFLASIPRFVTPILLAGLGGAICQRAGVFNIALEGFMLAGAFAAVCGAYFLGSPVAGAGAAVLAGIAAGLVFAWFHLKERGDPIVVSIAMNILLAGLTVFLLGAVLDASGAFRDPAIAGFRPIAVPGLEAVPVLGPLLSGQSAIFYLALLLTLFLHVFMARHRIGIRLRAVGENEAAVRAAGVDPLRLRALALILCGALCGLAGAQLSIANVSLFVEDMSAGRGWIAVVAVLLTGGRILPLFAIATLFGLVDSFSFRVQGLGLAQQFSDMLPYLATLIVLIVLSWRRRRLDPGAY